MPLTNFGSCVRLDVRGSTLRTGHGSTYIRDSSPVGNGTSLFTSVQGWSSVLPRRCYRAALDGFFSSIPRTALARRPSMKHTICQITVEQTENPNTKQKFISFYQGSAKIHLTIDQIPSFLKVVDQFYRDHSVQNICEEVSRLFEGEKR